MESGCIELAGRVKGVTRRTCWLQALCVTTHYNLLRRSHPAEAVRAIKFLFEGIAETHEGEESCKNIEQKILEANNERIHLKPDGQNSSILPCHLLHILNRPVYTVLRFTVMTLRIRPAKGQAKDLLWEHGYEQVNIELASRSHAILSCPLAWQRGHRGKEIPV